MKTVHFVCGLPRSCSTLLMNILAQNPRFHATATSGLPELVACGRRALTEMLEFKAMPQGQAETLFHAWARGGIGHAYDDMTERPVVFDKGRAWNGYLDLLFKLFPDAKVLVTVRDMRGVLASYEKLWRKHPAYFSHEELQAMGFTTVAKRVQSWLSGPKLGMPVERLFEAVQRFGTQIYTVNAKRLTTDKQAEMERIYRYLGEEPFQHDFDNVQQYTEESDSVWQPYGQHKIRPKVEPVREDWDHVFDQELADSIDQKFRWISVL